MSSSYSSNLRVELIGSGDQAGTWGTTTDNNFAYIFDTAIAGYQTVSVTAANQALTYVNGPTSTVALNQSVYAMLRLTTTTGANFAVYAPPVSKQYVIYNNSGYTATIYNSTVIGNTTAAGTGISIADGKKVLVFSDATNFYTIDAANLTGTLAIVNGGTGQTTANAAFNALAPSQTSANGKYLKSDGTNTSWDAIDISTSDVSGVLLGANGGTGVANTGKTITLGGNLTTSGAFATTLTSTALTSVTLPTTGTLATLAGTETLTNKTLTSPTLNSPTLTTPVLGTPSSGTLTSCTGLPLTTGVTGTLPVANGGTGVTTSTGSGNNVLSTSPTLVTPILGTPTSGTLSSCTGLPLTTGVTGTLPVANGGTGVTTSTGTGNVVLSTSPTLTTPVLGTPSSGTLTSCTGLPLTTGVTGTLPIANGGTGTTSTTFANLTTNVTGTLPVANGGTGVTASTGSGNNVLSTSPTLVTPILGTPTSGTLTSCTGLPLTTGVTGTLPVANGGTGVTTSTGSGNNVLSTSPTITSPTITGAVVSSMASSVITSGTAVASTSGTSIDFTGLPSWIKKITVMFSGVSTSGTNAIVIQLGYSGGFTGATYTSSGGGATTGGASAQTTTTGLYGMNSLSGGGSGSAGLFSGITTLANISGNTWISTSVAGQNSVAFATWAGGVGTAGGALTQIRVTTTTGVDTFDAGSINILYE